MNDTPSTTLASETELLRRIKELTGNARNTWFVLLGVLVFVGVTLMGVEPIDFYGVDRATQLPLLNVSVPTRLFFIAAPILTAAVYGYFHLYLIRLWHALGKAEPQQGDTPLGDVVPPWLVTDAVLLVRWWRLREEPPCIARRRLEVPSALLKVALSWVAGLFVLGMLWWQTMTAHHLLMTGVAGVSLLMAVWAGATSFAVMWRHMGRTGGKRRSWAGTGLRGLLALFAVVAVGLMSSERSAAWFGLHSPANAIEAKARNWLETYSMAGTGTLHRVQSRTETGKYWTTRMLGLAPINLSGEALVEKPAGWLPRHIARKVFLSDWCKRESPADCRNLTEDEQTVFNDEWRTRRAEQLDGLKKQTLNPLRSDQLAALSDLERDVLRWRAPDLRYGNLQGAFLGGMNLAMAKLYRVNLNEAQMEGTDFSFALMSEARLGNSQMDGATFSQAQLDKALFENSLLNRANFRDANLPDAIFTHAEMANADLSRAKLTGGDLRWAQLSAAKLVRTDLTMADLSGAQLQGANLSAAILDHADLRFADIVDADLSFAQMNCALLSVAKLQLSDLSMATLRGADLNAAQLTRATLSSADLEAADLSEATMSGARLDGAHLLDTNLQDANLSGAQFDYSYVAGTAKSPNILHETDLRGVTNNGGALRQADLSRAIIDVGTDFRNVFLDGSVILPEGFRVQMGDPCQWTDEVLSDEAFFGRWRWWVTQRPAVGLKHAWSPVAPVQYRDFQPVGPDEACDWNTKPFFPSPL